MRIRLGFLANGPCSNSVSCETSFPEITVIIIINKRQLDYSNATVGYVSEIELEVMLIKPKKKTIAQEAPFLALAHVVNFNKS